MKCRNCNSEMQYKVEGHTASWTCPQCGWGLATSHYEPIELDQTTYTIHIGASSAPSVDMIKCVARLSGCNSIVARSSLTSGTASISGRATKIKCYLEQLSTVGLDYHIEPEFPY